MFTGKHQCQSLFLSCIFIKKETLVQGFSCEFCKTIQNTFFTQHLWMIASILQQLLAIIYSWQLSSSEKSLVGKKIDPFISGILLILISFFHFFLSFFSFSLTNACLPCQLCKAYAVLWAANLFVGLKALNAMILINFENSNSISNIFQETRFLSFDGPSNYLFLFQNHPQTFTWTFTSKLLNVIWSKH